MVKDLRARGMTDWKLAQAIGYNHPKEVQAIVDGRVPRHDIGELLIGLHGVVCPNGLSPTGPVLRETSEQ